MQMDADLNRGGANALLLVSVLLLAMATVIIFSMLTGMMIDAEIFGKISHVPETVVSV